MPLKFLEKSVDVLAVNPRWSGNELVEDSNLSKFLSHSRSKKGMASSCLVAAGLLYIVYFSTMTYTANGDVVRISLIPDYYYNGIIVWISATLLLAAVYIYKKSYRSAGVKTYYCSECGNEMEPAELHCNDCRGTFKRGTDESGS